MRILFVDTETTGLDEAQDEIVEVAGVLFDRDRELGAVSSLARPQRLIPREAARVHGFDNELLRFAPLVQGALSCLAALWHHADAVAAYNASFDRAFLRRADPTASILPPRPWIDVLEASRRAWPELQSHRLVDVCHGLDIPLPRAHRALDDARAAAEVWRRTSPSPPPQEESPARGPLSLFR